MPPDESSRLFLMPFEGGDAVSNRNCSRRSGLNLLITAILGLDENGKELPIRADSLSTSPGGGREATGTVLA